MRRSRTSVCSSSIKRASATGTSWDCARRRCTAIADSPVGLAAYFLDHDARSYALIARVFDGQSEGLTRDDILDNITITWLTNTAVSGARLYWETWGKLGYFNVKGVSIPVAVSVFPDEIYTAPRSWAERAFPKLIHYNKVDERRALRGLGTAAALLRRGSRGLQIAAQIVEAEQARSETGRRGRTSSPPALG